MVDVAPRWSAPRAQGVSTGKRVDRSSAGGLSLWVELDAPRSTALAAIGDRYGLRLAAGPRFGVDGAFERFMRLPFSLPEPVLEDAASRLAIAWRGVSESGPMSVEPPTALVA